MAADSEKNKRTLTVLGYLGQFLFYGGLLALIAGTILARTGVTEDDAARIGIAVGTFAMVFGFAMAWGAGNNRAILELQERVAALEERDRSG
jgi:hypothetical protein